MKLRIAGYQDARSVHTRAMRALEASLKTKLGDGIAVEFEENIATRGRKVTDLLDLVESGELDLCYFSSSYVTARVPTLGVFDIPFAMTDRNRTRTLLQGALGERLASDVAARTAYKVLGFWDNGPRHISNRLRAIRMPADCKGIRIRTLPSAGHHATYRALGMEPVTIDIRDFVEAIASEKVDAQENPLTNVRQFGLQKYHRHVTMTAHFHGIALLLCNAKMLDTCAPAHFATRWRRPHPWQPGRNGISPRRTSGNRAPRSKRRASPSSISTTPAARRSAPRCARWPSGRSRHCRRNWRPCSTSHSRNRAPLVCVMVAEAAFGRFQLYETPVPQRAGVSPCWPTLSGLAVRDFDHLDRVGLVRKRNAGMI